MRIKTRGNVHTYLMYKYELTNVVSIKTYILSYMIANHSDILGFFNGNKVKAYGLNLDYIDRMIFQSHEVIRLCITNGMKDRLHLMNDLRGLSSLLDLIRKIEEAKKYESDRKREYEKVY